jgi:hypothetical protein
MDPLCDEARQLLDISWCTLSLVAEERNLPKTSSEIEDFVGLSWRPNSVNPGKAGEIMGNSPDFFGLLLLTHRDLR